MAATIKIYEKNGAGETATDQTGANIYFHNSDSASWIGTGIAVPSAGNTNYSYEKYLQVNITGSYTSIRNIDAYTSGSNSLSPGEAMYMTTVSSYTQPVGATSTSGYTSVLSYTSGSPLVVGAGPYTGTGYKGNYIKLIATLTDTARATNEGAAQTLTISWDEIS